MSDTLVGLLDLCACWRLWSRVVSPHTATNRLKIWICTLIRGLVRRDGARSGIWLLRSVRVSPWKCGRSGGAGCGCRGSVWAP